MTPKQVALVQDSFAKVALTSEAAAMLFYDRLFEIAPQTRAMFPDDMIEQRRKLMAMLAGVVRSWQSRTGFAGRQRTGKAACQLRYEGGALSGGRRRVAVDAREGPGGWLDAGSGGCVGHRLWHAVRLHDFRSIWSQSGCRVRDIPWASRWSSSL